MPFSRPLSVLAWVSVLSPAAAVREEEVDASNRTAGYKEMCCCPDEEELSFNVGRGFGFKVTPSLCMWNTPSEDSSKVVFGISLEKRGEREYATINAERDLSEDKKYEEPDGPDKHLNFQRQPGDKVICNFDPDAPLRFSECMRNQNMQMTFPNYEDPRAMFDPRNAKGAPLPLRVGANGVLKKWYCPSVQCKFKEDTRFKEDCLDAACHELGVPCKEGGLTAEDKQARREAIAKYKITFLTAEHYTHAYLPSVCVSSDEARAKAGNKFQLWSGISSFWQWSCPSGLVECPERHRNTCIEQANIKGWSKHNDGFKCMAPAEETK